jgi:DNA-binding NarL/FixJ family response regulator
MTKISERHIFLADDDCEDRELFAEAISLIDDDTILLTQLKDGEELLDKLKMPSAPLPEIVFLDLNMQKKTGLDCLEEIKSRLKEIKVVMFTTSTNPRDIEQAFSKGASLYAIKPSNFTTLKLLIESVLHYKWPTSPTRSSFLMKL